MIVYLILLADGSRSYIERFSYITWANGMQEHFISSVPTSSNFTKNYRVMAISEEKRARYFPKFVSSSLQNLDELSWNYVEALTTLLLSIVNVELSQCVLGIVWDSSFIRSTIIDSLSHLHHAKQVWHKNKPFF